MIDAKLVAGEKRDVVGLAGSLLILIASVGSLPGYGAFGLALAAELLLRFLRQSNLAFSAGSMQAWADVLRFFGQLTHPATLALVLVASFFPMKGQGKRIAWAITAGGILTWLISGWMILHSS